MKIHNFFLAIFFLLVIVGNIQAASFDCGKASTEVEKMICGDDELSRLDESLNKAYLQAVKRTDTKKQIIETQRLWLKGLGAKTDSARGIMKCSIASLQ